MSFFPPEAVALLSSFVGLPRPIQGMINKTSSAVTHFSAGGDTFKELMERIRYDTLCVESPQIMTVNNVLNGAAGTQIAGQFKIQGSFVQGTTEMENVPIFLGTAKVLESPDLGELVSADGTYLFAFPESAAKPCTDSSLVPFGTQNAKRPLAPQATYLASLASHKLSKALIACANGVFTVQTTDAEKFSQKKDVYSNLANLQFVAWAREKIEPATDASEGFTQNDTGEVTPLVIYRISANAILVGQREESEKVADVQKILGTAADSSSFLNSVSRFAVTKGLVEFSGKPSGYDKTSTALKTIFGDRVRLRNESLSNWQRPALVVRATVKIENAPSSTAAIDGTVTVADITPAAADPAFTDHFVSSDGRLGVVIDCSSVPVRTPLPGERPTDPETQLKRAVMTSIEKKFRDTSAAEFEGKQESVSQEMGDDLREQLQTTGLYKVPVVVRIWMKASKSVGREINLPNGMKTILPPYASTPSSARLAALTVGSAELGMELTFTNWETSKINGVSAR